MYRNFTSDGTYPIIFTERSWKIKPYAITYPSDLMVQGREFVDSRYLVRDCEGNALAQVSKCGSYSLEMVSYEMVEETVKQLLEDYAPPLHYRDRKASSDDVLKEVGALDELMFAHVCKMETVSWLLPNLSRRPSSPLFYQTVEGEPSEGISTGWLETYRSYARYDHPPLQSFAILLATKYGSFPYNNCPQPFKYICMSRKSTTPDDDAPEIFNRDMFRSGHWIAVASDEALVMARLRYDIVHFFEI